MPKFGGMRVARISESIHRRCYSSLVPPLIDVRCFDEAFTDRDRHAQAREAAAAASACRTHGLLALPAYGGIPPARCALTGVRLGDGVLMQIRQSCARLELLDPTHRGLHRSDRGDFVYRINFFN